MPFHLPEAQNNVHLEIMSLSATSNGNKKKMLRSLGVLVVGAILTGGGIFLWQNEFNISLFSSASTESVQAIVSLGETAQEAMPTYSIGVSKYLSTKQPKSIELINRAEEGTAISTLRDQAVLAYNDITRPITKHVIFLVITGRITLVNGIKSKDSVSSIATRITKEVSELVELASARPGVFPAGYTIYLATLPDPLDGTGDTTYCKGAIPNYGKEYTKGILKEINASLRSVASIYPLSITLVELDKDFTNHGLTSNQPWFANCLTLNDDGYSALETSFVKAVQSPKK